MPRYRRRTPEVEAFSVHYTLGEPLRAESSWPSWFLDALQGSGVNSIAVSRSGVMVLTSLQGVLVIRPGDYVQRNGSGELYAFRPEVFEREYELIKENEDEG